MMNEAMLKEAALEQVKLYSDIGWTEDICLVLLVVVGAFLAGVFGQMILGALCWPFVVLGSSKPEDDDPEMRFFSGFSLGFLATVVTLTVWGMQSAPATLDKPSATLTTQEKLNLFTYGEYRMVANIAGFVGKFFAGAEPVHLDNDAAFAHRLANARIIWHGWAGLTWADWLWIPLCLLLWAIVAVLVGLAVGGATSAMKAPSTPAARS